MGIRFRALAGAVAMSMAALVLQGCGGDSDAKSITVYNAQHRELVEVLTKGFTKDTGIKVKLRNGSDFELANQIVQEGAQTPADVFLTENSPAMTLLDEKKAFAEVDAATLAQVPSRYVPSDKSWTGFAARSTVLAYNSQQLQAAQLPASIMDLASPQWSGKIGFSPAGADFQAIVSAVLELKGEAATAEWLKGLKANAKVYQGNVAVMKAVNAGEIQAGVIYHYYWYKDRAESGANSKNTELHIFGANDPGAFVSVSGAGVIAASKKQAEAQQFVKYLTSAAGQKLLADNKALEYTVGSDVPSSSKLKPLSEIDAPELDIAKLNGPKVVEMMQKAGLL